MRLKSLNWKHSAAGRKANSLKINKSKKFFFAENCLLGCCGAWRGRKPQLTFFCYTTTLNWLRFVWNESTFRFSSSLPGRPDGNRFSSFNHIIGELTVERSNCFNLQRFGITAVGRQFSMDAINHRIESSSFGMLTACHCAIAGLGCVAAKRRKFLVDWGWWGNIFGQSYKSACGMLISVTHYIPTFLELASKLFLEFSQSGLAISICFICKYFTRSAQRLRSKSRLNTISISREFPIRPSGEQFSINFANNSLIALCLMEGEAAGTGNRQYSIECNNSM